MKKWDELMLDFFLFFARGSRVLAEESVVNRIRICKVYIHYDENKSFVHNLLSFYDTHTSKH